jgi:hypothetical protein
MNRYTFSPQEEAEFDMVMAQAREDAWTFGISQRFEAYLEQFAPEERMQRVLAMFAALENQFELCQRMLAIKFSERDKKKGARNPSKDRDVVELVRELALLQPDSYIASTLNRLGYHTGTGNTWNETRVKHLRNYNQIPVFVRGTDRSWLALEEAAATLKTGVTVIRNNDRK